MQNCQWLDKHVNCIRDNILCIPNSLKCYISMHRGAVSIEENLSGGGGGGGCEYGTYGQIRAIKGKYDQIRIINATLGQI